MINSISETSLLKKNIVLIQGVIKKRYSKKIMVDKKKHEKRLSSNSQVSLQVEYILIYIGTSFGKTL